MSCCGWLTPQAALPIPSHAFPLACSGSLDASATGLVVIMTGMATKLMDAFGALDREYSGVIRLGMATSTGDYTGKAAETMPWKHITGARGGCSGVWPPGLRFISDWHRPQIVAVHAMFHSGPPCGSPVRLHHANYEELM
jgi:hypothetical protein